MAKTLKSIKHVGLNAPTKPTLKSGLKAVVAGPFLELSVTKTGGPVSTRVEVGSTGTDSQTFNDGQLTPGPVRKALIKGNFYAVVWQGAFVAPGTAKLRVRIVAANGNVSLNKVVTAKHPPIGKTFTLVVL
jgi:hypothetical protein